MEQEYAIEVNHISKSFKVYLDKGHELKEQVISRKRRRHETREVLKDISFSVKKGEAIGLIGHNGCGKSTTLKLLTKIMYPDSGTITMRGRVSSLIELGAGFHPDMSGRENIYINASIFGLTRKEIDQRLDDIIAFSELEEFIDNPVRTYSSGMYMRLAFSVAINVDADILLVDEILAVGDVNFQAKCFNRMREIKAEGTTIVIVSHSLGQIEQICERSIWIHDGKIRAEGKPREIHPEYLDYMGGKREEIAKKEKERQEAKINDEKHKVELQDQNNSLRAENIQIEDNGKRWGNGFARITQIQMVDVNNVKKTVFKTGENVRIIFKYILGKKVNDAIIGIGIYQKNGIRCYGTNTRIDKLKKYDLEKDGEVVIELLGLNLIAGQYTLDVAIEAGDNVPIDYYREAYQFEMYSEIDDIGISRIAHNWII